jgi:PLP dependent protein
MEVPLSLDFHARLKEIRDRMERAADRSGRRLSDVTLLAVTKTHPLEVLSEAYGAGLRDFGENRVQEALPKIVALPPDIHWHLIGRLQSNKINKALGRFELIHSVDSPSLAAALSARQGGTTQDVLLEVNTSGEASKAGVGPEDAQAAAERVSRYPGLKLRGLMTVGPLTDDPEASRAAFRLLKGIFERIRAGNRLGEGFSILSMGMSVDFEAAIEEGSTLVRIGRALFGERRES